MKLHRLELTGFGPFRERQTIDFDAFDRDGVFLISGRTGAGKSSILDGVSFALYGAVPRYESGERRLRSDHSFVGDPTEVRLEFTVADRRWRVTRAPDYERPAKRGNKLTTEPARAELDELVDGAWVGRAAKPRDVGIALDEVLGLNAQQFQQVILLAQNKFSRFLLARNDERQQLLRTLFGTRRFEQYKDDLEQRRRAAQKDLEAVSEQAMTYLDLAEATVREHHLGADDARARDSRAGDGQPDEPALDDPAAASPAPTDLPGRRAALERALQRARYRVEQGAELQAQADAAAAAAAAVHADRVARARDLADLAAARARHELLEADAPARAAEATMLARAREAESLRAPLEAATREAQAADAASRAAAVALARWHSVGDETADLPSVVDDLTGDIARLTETALREHELEGARADLTAAETAAAELAARLETLDAQRAAVPAEREAIDAQRAATLTEAARHGDLAARRAELAEQDDAAREADEASRLVAELEADYARTSAAAATAAAAVTTLLQRRLNGRAAELATDLVDGEPCVVCGSPDHPHPAPPADDPVTDDDLAAAEAARDSANEVARQTGERAARARGVHGDAAARAGGRDAATTAVLLAEATAAAAGAAAAAERLRDLDARRADLDELSAAADAEHARLAAELAGTRERAAALAATARGLDDAIGTARGAFPSVAARLADCTERRDLARAALVARSTADERDRTRAAAEADRDARIAASAFADPDDVASALRDEVEQKRIDVRLAEHAAALTAARARLLELELATVGDDTAPDLDVSAAAVAETDAARTAAIAAARDATNAADRLGDLIARVTAAAAEIDDRAQTTAVVTRLADTVAGRAPNTRKMDLETFVLAAELEEIVAAANLRLRDMSSGRYTLHHSDALQARGAASGLSLDVLDAHTGRLRSPQSLSGGETFLASLALALGLAEVVTGRAGGLRLDTLFIDEGFGSLDPETLDLAMRTLDALRAGGRTVGVISHVEAMKEQLPAQLVVESTPEGPSIIRQQAGQTSR